MPLRSYVRRRLIPRLFFSLSMAILPLLLGGALIYWETLRSMSLEANNSAQEAARLFDIMLGNAESTARVTLSHQAEPCEKAVQVMREQVAIVPFVRSLSLALNDSIYCSSIYGPYADPVASTLYAEGRLRLMAGNSVTPDSALLVLRRVEGSKSALSTVDGRYLSNTLQLVDQRADLQLVVGDQWMDEQGYVRHDRPVPLPLGSIQVPSTRFPYMVIGGFPAGSQWQIIRADSLPMVIVLLVLGLISGITSFWAWGRAGTPSMELGRAMLAGEFIPYLQPLVDAKDGRWVGAEVLMRWIHPEEGMIGPDLFIPFAERSGLIVPMTRALMCQVGKALAPHSDLLGNDFHLSINISAPHCTDASLLEDCLTLQRQFLPYRPNLFLELTEREMLVANDTTDRLFADLDAKGVRLAIDDFGTGNSSLAYLQRFKTDALKIDRSFVSMIGVNALSRHILDSIVELCAKLNLLIVAEGVETQEQWDYLSTRGVGILQGYLFAKPMPLDEFVKKLQEQRTPQ